MHDSNQVHAQPSPTLTVIKLLAENVSLRCQLFVARLKIRYLTFKVRYLAMRNRQLVAQQRIVRADGCRATAFRNPAIEELPHAGDSTTATEGDQR